MKHAGEEVFIMPSMHLWRENSKEHVLSSEYISLKRW
jgi:hypothetical protein